MNAVTVLFLGVLAVVILCAARVVLWLLPESDRRVDQLVGDALADADAGRADYWSDDEWWRR